ncbi:MAG: hypothetical protein ACFFCS_21590 [Candidatus Hodarchaeota archaeon]
MITKQSTLNNFCDFLPAARPLRLDKALEWELEPKISDNSYTVNLKGENIIEIEEMHCKDCGCQLYHNGYNPKQPVLDRSLGKRYYRVHRKRCPRCGEIKPDYSVLAPAHGHYHENFKRKARQHYINGQSISWIKMTLEVDLEVPIPYTTIVDWVVNMEEPLKDLLSTTWLPLSGYLHHDETFASIAGQEQYVITSIDSVTGFAPRSTVSSRNTKRVHRKHFNRIKRPNKLVIKAIIADGTKTFESLFDTRYLKFAIRAQCLMHFKWRSSKKLKKFAGLGETSIKPLLKKLRSFKKAFYDVFGSNDTTGAYVALERLRCFVEKANEKYLTTLFEDIESRIPQITAWQRDLRIPKTNNKCENFNQYLQRHLSFKGRSRNQEALGRICDCRTYKHNRSRFNSYLDKIRRLRVEYEHNTIEKPIDPTLKGCGTWLFHERRRTLASLEKYDIFWTDYLEIIGRKK